VGVTAAIGADTTSEGVGERVSLVVTVLRMFMLIEGCGELIEVAAVILRYD
jgi:hypothetical protein